MGRRLGKLILSLCWFLMSALTAMITIGSGGVDSCWWQASTGSELKIQTLTTVLLYSKRTSDWHITRKCKNELWSISGKLTHTFRWHQIANDNPCLSSSHLDEVLQCNILNYRLAINFQNVPSNYHHWPIYTHVWQVSSWMLHQESEDPSYKEYESKWIGPQSSSELFSFAGVAISSTQLRYCGWVSADIHSMISQTLGQMWSTEQEEMA